MGGKDEEPAGRRRFGMREVVHRGLSGNRRAPPPIRFQAKVHPSAGVFSCRPDERQEAIMPDNNRTTEGLPDAP
jgi:hypothetical protein